VLWQVFFVKDAVRDIVTICGSAASRTNYPAHALHRLNRLFFYGVLVILQAANIRHFDGSHQSISLQTLAYGVILWGGKNLPLFEME
jgi:hypothetical protein